MTTDSPSPGPSALAPEARRAVTSAEAGSTKERLLDAAERLFAERGFEGTSMRAVTQAAGVSVSAANYHFGSKQALLHATLLRVIDPVNRERLARLDALEQAAAGEPPSPISLEAVLDTFLAPALEARAESATNPARYRNVAARIYSDPPHVVAALKDELFSEVLQRYVGALHRALPGRAVDELLVAFELVVGSMVHVLAGGLETTPSRGLSHDFGELLPSDALLVDELLVRMTRYAAAGLRAVPALGDTSEDTHAPAGSLEP